MESFSTTRERWEATQEQHPRSLCSQVENTKQDFTLFIAMLEKQNRPRNCSADVATTSNANLGSSRHVVKVSRRFVVLSLLSCVLVAFAVGRTARMLLFVLPHKELLVAHQEALASMSVVESASKERVLKLPTPVLPGGKVLPQTTYTSKTFDTARSSINSRWVVTEEGKRQCVDLPGNDCPARQELLSSQLNDSSATTRVENNHDEDVHMPQGQHLLIDIENVDGEFLNSEERLANAMLDMVNECGLTLLSYHCHGLTPSGISCAGVLLESHVSFHTWPAEGVITLDLFTCGDESLLPIVPLAEKLFSIPRPDATEKPQMVWAHKYRGFYDSDEDEKSDLTDFFNFPIGHMTDFKSQVCSEQTNFQRIDVVDVLRPGHQSVLEYQRSLHADGSYESQHPELFAPDRLVFLDGVLQSRRSGDAAYHEALVHPGMFAHPNPKRVAIIGGGEGATLREILKHKTVEKVVMIEIDEQMVNLSRKFLPDWSDCSMLEGNNGSCFEDPRVELFCEDAFGWFINRFSGIEGNNEEPFDVIIMDALDPQIQKEFVDALYDGGPFLGSLPAAIADGGVLIAQVGEASHIRSPPEHISINRNRVNFIRSLVDLGFEVVRDYEEARGGFETAWQIVVAFKSSTTNGHWLSDSSLVNYKIRSRTIPTRTGGSPLLIFDGATMLSYMYPSKGSEVVYCRRMAEVGPCVDGHGFDQARNALPASALEIKQTNHSRGVIAKKEIPHPAYVGLEEAVGITIVNLAASEVIRQSKDYAARRSIPLASIVPLFVDQFGHRDDRSFDTIVQTSLLAFVNEECEGTHNVRSNESGPNTGSKYNPMLDRQVHRLGGVSTVIDIHVGEELLQNGGDTCASYRDKE